MKCYRKIWREANGPIPKDEEGRSYEIHHINGDHSDNRLENLKCVSIREHFEIHLKQGDHQAAAAVARRIRISSEEQKRLDSLAGKQAFKDKKGFHAFSPEEKAVHSRKGGLAHRGKVWWTNGDKDTKSTNCPGEGWYRGRNVSGTGPKIGTKLGTFWNDGSINKRSVESPGPEWSPGKLLNEQQRQRRSEIASETLRKRWSKNTEN
jgi:hypothetical protein